MQKESAAKPGLGILPPLQTSVLALTPAGAHGKQALTKRAPVDACVICTPGASLQAPGSFSQLVHRHVVLLTVCSAPAVKIANVGHADGRAFYTVCCVLFRCSRSHTHFQPELVASYYMWPCQAIQQNFCSEALALASEELDAATGQESPGGECLSTHVG